MCLELDSNIAIFWFRCKLFLVKCMCLPVCIFMCECALRLCAMSSELLIHSIRRVTCTLIDINTAVCFIAMVTMGCGHYFSHPMHYFKENPVVFAQRENMSTIVEINDGPIKIIRKRIWAQDGRRIHSAVLPTPKESF